MPSLSFEFDAYTSVVVTQVVPSQVILFRHSTHDFSPLGLDAFSHR